MLHTGPALILTLSNIWSACHVIHYLWGSKTRRDGKGREKRLRDLSKTQSSQAPSHRTHCTDSNRIFHIASHALAEWRLAHFTKPFSAVWVSSFLSSTHVHECLLSRTFASLSGYGSELKNWTDQKVANWNDSKLIMWCRVASQYIYHLKLDEKGAIVRPLV